MTVLVYKLVTIITNLKGETKLNKNENKSWFCSKFIISKCVFIVWVVCWVLLYVRTEKCTMLPIGGFIDLTLQCKERPRPYQIRIKVKDRRGHELYVSLSTGRGPGTLSREPSDSV